MIKSILKMTRKTSVQVIGDSENNIIYHNNIIVYIIIIHNNV